MREICAKGVLEQGGGLRQRFASPPEPETVPKHRSRHLGHMGTHAYVLRMRYRSPFSAGGIRKAPPGFLKHVGTVPDGFLTAPNGCRMAHGAVFGPVWRSRVGYWTLQFCYASLKHSLSMLNKYPTVIKKSRRPEENQGWGITHVEKSQETQDFKIGKLGKYMGNHSSGVSRCGKDKEKQHVHTDASDV